MMMYVISGYPHGCKNRKHGSNSTSLKEKWADPEWSLMMLTNRKLAKERKMHNET